MGCRIYWVDRPLESKKKALADAAELSEKERENVCAPYDPAEVAVAGMLAGMTSAAPADLPKLNSSRAPWKHVLRRADNVFVVLSLCCLRIAPTGSSLSGPKLSLFESTAPTRTHRETIGPRWPARSLAGGRPKRALRKWTAACL